VIAEGEVKNDYNDGDDDDIYIIYKVVQIRPEQLMSNLHTNQSRSYLYHLVLTIAGK
jgi:hypothetical protein